MDRHPRASRSLRAFSGVGIQSTLPTADELREELIYKRKRKAELQSITWRDFKQIVDEKCEEKERKAVSIRCIMYLIYLFTVVYCLSMLKFMCMLYLFGIILSEQVKSITISLHLDAVCAVM